MTSLRISLRVRGQASGMRCGSPNYWYESAVVRAVPSGCEMAIDLGDKPREERRIAERLSWLERIPDKDEVTSSILVSPTEVVQ